MQPIASPKRAFYLVMGGVCLFLSSAILSRMAFEFHETGTTTYGQGIPFDLPILQMVHIVAGIALWGAVLLLGATWCGRAVKGQEKLSR